MLSWGEGERKWEGMHRLVTLGFVTATEAMFVDGELDPMKYGSVTGGGNPISLCSDVKEVVRVQRDSSVLCSQSLNKCCNIFKL